MRVVVVDDSSTMRKMISKCLREVDSGDLEVVEASDGIHALAAISQEAGGVDLILCDMNMPRVNGLSLLRSVRGTPEFDRVPFILVTGDAEENTAAQALREGAADVIAKPFTMRKLNQAVSQWLPRGRGGRAMFKTGRESEKIRLVAGWKKSNSEGRGHSSRKPGGK